MNDFIKEDQEMITKILIFFGLILPVVPLLVLEEINKESIEILYEGQKVCDDAFWYYQLAVRSVKVKIDISSIDKEEKRRIKQQIEVCPQFAFEELRSNNAVSAVYEPLKILYYYASFPKIRDRERLEKAKIEIKLSQRWLCEEGICMQ